MKVLVATEKPFAKVAVDGIRKEIEAAGYELALLEKYTDKAQLLDAVKDANAIIIRSDIIDAEELDAACRRCIRMEVSATGLLARVLDSMLLEYRISSDTTAVLFAKPSVTQLAVSLAEEGCEVLSMTEKDESLESYYVSLVGGGSYE